jgi:hypothetical protein
MVNHQNRLVKDVEATERAALSRAPPPEAEFNLVLNGEIEAFTSHRKKSPKWNSLLMDSRQGLRKMEIGAPDLVAR